MSNFSIQMVDLHNQYLHIQEEIDNAIQNVLNHTRFINGPEVNEFAQKLSAFHNVQSAVTCGNCTDALQIALMTLGLNPGDEVIIPAFTYIATAEVIALLKLKPVFVDVDYKTFNISVKEIVNNISNKTRAIIPVHLFGQCANMEPIIELGREYNISIIEDSAQAIGAEYTFNNGTSKKAGTLGDMGCLSFFPSKNLGCFGDGGAIISENQEMLVKAKMIASHGQAKKYHHSIVGCNSRLDTLQAAILNVKIKYLDKFTAERQGIALRYNSALKDIEGIEIPLNSPESTHVYHQYTLKIKKFSRDKFKEKLLEKGVPTMVYYPLPLHFQKAYKNGYLNKGGLSISEQLSNEVLSLPIHTEMDDHEQDFIIEKVVESIKELR